MKQSPVPGLCLDALLVAVCVILPGILQADLLRHLSEYTYFSTEPLFISTFWDNPGEILDWLGAFFTRLGAYPLVGALALGLLLVTLRRLLVRITGNEMLSFIPPLLLLLFVTGMDYGVYVLKSYGTAFSPILGLLATVLQFLGFRALLPHRTFRWLIPVLAALLFPVFGFYTLAAVLMTAFAGWSRNRWVCALLVAELVLLPLAAAWGSWYPAMNLRFAFFGGLPYRDFVGASGKFIPLALAVVVTVLFPFAARIRLPRWASAAVCAVALAAVFGFTNWDKNFRTILQMEAAFARSDWDRVLSVAQKAQTPTRVHVVYRNMALYQKDALCDGMFRYPDGSVPLATRSTIPMSFLFATEACLRAGLVNYAERWSTELSATYTKNVHYLKCLAWVAVLNGDRELADKYFSLLERCPFTKKWVGRFAALADNPARLREDPEMVRILDLMGPDDRRVIAGEAIEGVILDHFASIQPLNARQYQWKMASLLTLKREAAVMDAFLSWQAAHPEEPVPAAIAQAAVLFGGTGGDRELYMRVFDIFRGNATLLRDFGAYGRDYNNVANPDAQATAARFARKYGGTYWYYYHFVHNLETN